MIKIYLIAIILISINLYSNVIITETMPAPIGEEPEWIEIYNNSEKDEFYDSLYILDRSKKALILNFQLEKNQYGILVKDTNSIKKLRDIPVNSKLFSVNIPSLNNTVDSIWLEYKGKLIDSFYYDMKWGKNGFSLERIDYDKPAIDKNNIQICYDSSGSTIGKENSRQENYNLYYPILINEIMFDVSTNNSEYIELYNTSDTLINLKGLKIYDGSKKFFQIIDNFYIIPKDYAILSMDSLIFNKFEYLKDSSKVFIPKNKISLNNDADKIILKNYKDETIDSISYNKIWHNKALNYTKDISLEKKEPTLVSYIQNNWTSSTAPLGGTPGKINSTNQILEINTNLEIEPNTISYSLSKEIEINIKYKIDFESSFINIKIFDLSGIEHSNPYNNYFSGRSGILKYNLTNEKGFRLPPSPYILNFEATDTNSGKVVKINELFVIAE